MRTGQGLVTSSNMDVVAPNRRSFIQLLRSKLVAHVDRSSDAILWDSVARFASAAAALDRGESPLIVGGCGREEGDACEL